MSATQSVRTCCPYCAAPIELVVDCSVASQEYIEDCEVCCRPIIIVVIIDKDGDVAVDVRQEGE